MTTSLTRIPFTLPDVGLREIRGYVYLRDAFLVLEVEDALLGEWDRDARTIEIEAGALSEIRLDRRLLKDRLVLQPATRVLLDAVPGDHVREVSLEIWRKYRRDVLELVHRVRARAASGSR